MQISSLKNIPQNVLFRGTEQNSKDKKINNSQNDKNHPFARYSKFSAQNTRKLSEGREKQDGKYKAASFLAASGALITGLSAFSKSIKSLGLNKKMQKAIKNSASSERINELKIAALKKQKGSAITLGISIALSLAAVGAQVLNRLDAEKTNKAENLATNKEMPQKLSKKDENIEENKISHDAKNDINSNTPAPEEKQSEEKISEEKSAVEQKPEPARIEIPVSANLQNITQPLETKTL